MNRRRKHGPDWLPPRCYQGKSAFEYRPISGGAVRLGKLDAPKQIILANYQAAVSIHNEPTGAFAQLVREYFKSTKYADLGRRTRSDYVGYSEKVLPVFGHMNRQRIKPHHIRQYMDKRGKTSKTQANREKSFMSAVFTWAYQYGKIKEVNPCHKVSKFTEPPRDRYIDDWEYDAVLLEAKSQPLLFAAMEVSYCCAAREADVWNLEKNQLLHDGIYICQGKTGVKQIKLWNPRLKYAINLALQQPELPSFQWVFTKGRNHHCAQGTLRKWFSDARNAAEAKYPDCKFDFTFHDIKAKAISDYEGGDKKEFSGHKTDSQVRVYDRKTKRSPTLN